jgi:ATP-binding protein involved in chromosome partitioning
MMEFDISEIKELLAQVKDPKSGISILETGLIHDISLDGRELNITLADTKLDDREKSGVHERIAMLIQDSYPELDINMHISKKAAFLNADEGVLPAVKHIIAVASGKGGVGKSTVSVNIAMALKRMGYKTGILDADVYGPSIPTMLGIKDQRPDIDNTYGKPKLVPANVDGLKAISIGMIVDQNQALVLRGPRLAGIIKQFIDDCLWGELDFLVVDLPPGTGDVQLTLVQSVPLSGAVMVTTPQDVALADAVRAMNMFRMQQINVSIIGVVENMSWFTPAELPDNKYYIFGEGGGAKLAELSDAPLLGQVPIIMGIREDGDAGTPMSGKSNGDVQVMFESIAKKLILQLDKILATNGKSKIVQIQK